MFVGKIHFNKLFIKIAVLAVFSPLRVILNSSNGVGHAAILLVELSVLVVAQGKLEDPLGILIFLFGPYRQSQ